jgi:hypothetical protein
VTGYAPAVVPDVEVEAGVELFPLPQPIAVNESSRNNIASPVHRRRRAGAPKNSRPAKARVPIPPNTDLPRDATLPAVVVSVRVAVAAVLPLMVTEDEMLHVGLSTGFAMLVVTAHDKLTCPVNPEEGLTVTAVVLPLVAPGFTVIAPLLLNEKLAATEVPVTIAEKLVEAVILPVVRSVPVTVKV